MEQTTNAIGWATVCNRFGMFSDKLTPVQYDNFLPFLPGNSDKKITITDQTKKIARELRKEKILPDVLDFILSQLGVFKDE